MTDEELQAIREREAKATSPPWRREEHASGFIIRKDNELTIERGVCRPPHPNQHFLIANFPRGSKHPPVPTKAARDEANSLFLLHARTDIPALLAEVDRLKARIKELES